MRTDTRPLPALDPGGRDSRDMAVGGFDYLALSRLIQARDQQPNSWRQRSALCHAYYDGKQLTPTQLEFLQNEALEPRVTNLIARIINSVLGVEARSRTSVTVNADTADFTDITDVLNTEMKEAQRETKADIAVSQAYSGQIKGGLGWVEVSRNSDPLEYPYRVIDVHRDEVHWDWAARDLQKRDARWIVRSRWFDLDDVVAAMPQHRAILEQMCNNWLGWAGNPLLLDESTASLEVTRAFDNFQRFSGSVSSREWLDGVRKRVRLYHVWYRVPATVVVFAMRPNRYTLFDANNRLHQMALQRGLIKLERKRSTQIRKAIFVGPFRLTDEGTNYRTIPLIPFIGFQDDEFYTPYGMIEGMIFPQDEYNERRLRMQWLLKAKQVLVDNDALDETANNYDDLADEVMRPDMTLVLNAARRNANAVQILSNLTLQKEQVDVMNDARMLIQDVPGVYGSQLGMAQGGVTANSAMQTLVEQGLTTLGEINDNYRNSRTMVFEALLDLIVEDLSQENLQIMVGEDTNRRIVVLNTWDPQSGLPKNRVSDAPRHVGLGDMPNTPAARMMQQTQISEIIKSLAGLPQAVGALVPPFIAASPLDSETRRQTIADFRQAMGLPSAMDAASRAQAQDAQAQAAAKAQQMNEAAGAAKIDEQKAKADKLRADAAFSLARARQTSGQPAGNAQAISDAIDEANGVQQPAGQPSDQPATALA